MSQQKIAYHSKGVSLKTVGWVISIIAIVISSLLVFSLFSLSYTYQEVSSSTQNYMEMKQVAQNVQGASDYLTEQVRLFVVNGEEKYMANYFKEADENQTREKSLEIIHEKLKESTMHEIIHSGLNNAVNESILLMRLEFYAFKLVCEDKGISYNQYPQVAEADISAVAPEDRATTAINAVFGEDYMKSKGIIS